MLLGCLLAAVPLVCHDGNTGCCAKLGETSGQAVFAREGKLLRATVRAGDLTRVLEDSAETCDGLAEATSLSLKLLAARAAEEAAAAPSSEAREWRRPSPPERFQPAPPEVVDLPPSSAPAPIAFPKLTLELSAGAALGFASSVAFSAQLTLRYRPWRYLSFEGSGTLMTFSTKLNALEAAGANLAVSMVGVTVGVCVHPLRLTRFVEPFLCAAGTVGALIGSGTGFAENRRAALPWGAFAPALVIQGDIARGLSWQTRAMLQVPFGQTSFSVDGLGEVFKSAPSSVLVMTGLAMSFL